MAKRRSTTVTSSLSSVCPAISARGPPHWGQIRSASSSSWMTSTTGRVGCGRGPWPRRRLARAGPGSDAGALLGLLTEDRLLAVGQNLLERVELALQRAGVLSLEAVDLRGQLGQPLVQAPVLAIEQHRHLTQRVDVVDPLDTHHVRSRSPRDPRVKSLLRERIKNRRTQCDATHQSAALQKQMQLAQRQHQRRLAGVAPQAGEAA